VTKKVTDNAALLAYLAHAVESARKEQIGFGERAAKDVANAIQWHADGALRATFTENYAKTTLAMIKSGQDLRLVYDNLIDRLTVIASGDSMIAETRALAVFARSLKDWL